MILKEGSMNYFKKIIFMIITILILNLFVQSVIPVSLFSGSLEPSAPPSSTMNTLDDIYNKITTGAVKASHEIEKTGIPGSTMHTLQEIYDAIPVGLTTAFATNVLSEKLVIIRSNGALIMIKGMASLGTNKSGTSTNDVTKGAVVINFEYWTYNGNRYSGVYYPVSANNVKSSITYGANNSVTGNLYLPAQSDVRINVNYGANGTEYTGTYSGNISTNKYYFIRTGQVIKYTNRDDGTYKNGYTGGYTNADGSWNGSTRFSTNAAGDVVIDNVTGLQWTRNNNLYGTMYWTNAVTNAKNCTVGGYTDWRMPNIKELYTIVDHSNDSPAIPSGHPFIFITGVVWSSTTCGSDPSLAWTVSFNVGGLNNNGTKSTELRQVWYCRGGP